MMLSAMTRVAPEQAEFSPALSSLLSSERFLRGTVVSKISRKDALNTSAVRNHLGLSRTHAKALLLEAKKLDFSRQSMIFVAHLDGEYYDFNVTDEPVVQWKDEMDYGVIVIHPVGFDDARIGVKCCARWELLNRSAPDAGHVVYLIVLDSIARISAEIRHGGYVSPTMQMTVAARDAHQGKQVVPMDAITGDALPVYIGKTSVGISKRLRQHVQSAAKGSTTRFHRAIAGGYGYAPMLPTVTAIDRAATEEGAYDLEEWYIKQYFESRDFGVLNTTHSRKAIAALLEQFPHLFDKKKKEQAEEMLHAARSGGANPWDDPLYAESVICNNERNFNSDEVRQIRMLSGLSSSVSEIARTFSTSPQRISKVIAGDTYARIL
jgi:hypothetical protein